MGRDKRKGARKKTTKKGKIRKIERGHDLVEKKKKTGGQGWAKKAQQDLKFRPKKEGGGPKKHDNETGTEKKNERGVQKGKKGAKKT